MIPRRVLSSILAGPVSVRALVGFAVSLTACVSPVDEAPVEHEAYRMGAAASALASSDLDCDVIVAGGSTAALSAALTSARAGARTCLLEPTDWPGGQLTASGVPAIDYAWHKIGNYDVGTVAKDPVNLPAEFVAWMAPIGAPTVQCSVSKDCYEPKALLANSILPALAGASNLRVLTNTVVKRVETESRNGRTFITKVTAIRRSARPEIAWGGYDKRLSLDMPDWYASTDSSRYTKEVLTLKSVRASGPVVVDATELGDVLVLSGAPYLQGVEVGDGSATTANDTCGQAFVYPFVMQFGDVNGGASLSAPVPDHPEFYGFGVYDWERIWKYRRVRGSGDRTRGQLSAQNWNPGNDYPYRYLLTSKSAAAAEVSDWKGGVDYVALEAAERHAYGWFRWLAEREPNGEGARLSIAQTTFGTGHGLSKFPYVRDTRRSIGVGGFILRGADLRATAGGLTGTRFIDRVGVGLYPSDIHPMKSCAYPGYVYDSLETLPFYIPLRALTNRDIANLVVAGKTMAQSFVANSATRLQPIEFASGVGAGAAAATMVAEGIADTAQVVRRYAAVQTIAKRYAPIDWTIAGLSYPRPNEMLAPLLSDSVLFCPPSTTPDLRLGYCVDDRNAYGPFTQKMTARCQSEGGGPACASSMAFTIDGHAVTIPRWSRSFAELLRGTATCMEGTHADAIYPTSCVEDATASASGAKEVYGPFDAGVVALCRTAGGGDACYTNRWNYAFFASLRARNE